MILETDWAEGRGTSKIESLTITAQGIFTSDAQIAEFTLDNGVLAIKDLRNKGLLLGSMTVKP